MSRIRLLPEHLVNKIAAGEVVERPSSVVKELVENAIDAGSTAITVELKDAGRQLIRVSDDGLGMDAGDIDLALLRHATSKIADEADLAAIASLGFRGEALPAICAVSRFQITSCPRGATTGALVRGAGGEVVDRLAIEAQPGTTVETQDLFFNTPARLKFLRSAPAELAAALRLLEGLALARPDLHLRVIHNGRVTLMAPAARSLRDRVGALRGFELAQAMLEVDRTQGSVRVEGLAVPPQLARGNRDEMTLIVNGRAVRDTALLQTLIEAYRPMLARHEFPSAVLIISMPLQELDVNVHPTKAWVRFRSPRLVQEAVFLAVQDALRSRRVVQPQQGLTSPDMDLDQALTSSSESTSFPQAGLSSSISTWPTSACSSSTCAATCSRDRCPRRPSSSRNRSISGQGRARSSSNGRPTWAAWASRSKSSEGGACSCAACRRCSRARSRDV